MRLLQDIIIAIDGYSSCGKSTLAKNLARLLEYRHIDTGAMYRAVAYWGMQNGWLQPEHLDKDELIRHLSEISIDFNYNAQNLTNEIWLNGKMVEEKIRTPEVSEMASKVSQWIEVREQLVSWQQQMGKAKKIVMDGRDIGTVVFPSAEVKIFMTASNEIRAQRRYNELIEKGIQTTYDEVLKNLIERDYQDTHRAVSPLKKANDAIILDNSRLTKEEQLQWIVNLLKQKFPYED